MADDRDVMRLVLAAAGLIGAAGVVSAAAASHGGEGRNLASIAAICLAHGPALLALALAGRGRLLRAAAVLLSVGTIVFVADLGIREWQGHGLFPGAAPIGGVGMIAGWIAVAAASIFWRRPKSDAV